MLYTGIDSHKKSSVVSTLDATGARVRAARIDQNEPAAFAAYFASLPAPRPVVLEACWNWGWLYDELGEIDAVEDVVLAHPFKTRLIADAQIKSDRLDARALATLLRGNLVATVHAPTPANRVRKRVSRWAGACRAAGCEAGAVASGREFGDRGIPVRKLGDFLAGISPTAVVLLTRTVWATRP